MDMQLLCRVSLAGRTALVFGAMGSVYLISLDSNGGQAGQDV